MTRRPQPAGGAAIDDGGPVPDPGGLLLASGVDVVSIDRIADLVGRFDGSFVERVYAPAERAYCSDRSQPGQHYAARWAAKEAAIKALPDGDGLVPMSSVRVAKDGARPTLELSGTAADAAAGLAERAGVDPARLHAGVSLSHDRTAGYATAHVILGRGTEGGSP